MTTTARSAAYDFLRPMNAVYRYLNQGDIWVPRPPLEHVQIAAIDPEWRWNCAQLLLRNATRHADRYGWGELSILVDAPDDVQHDSERWDTERRRDPQRWMRTTNLYRALVADLPAKRRDLTALADRARHWNTCLARVGVGPGEHGCTCDAGSAPAVADIKAAAAVIRDIQAAAAKAAALQREAAEREAKAQAFRDWMTAHPGIDPDTNRPYGVDEDGFDHNQPHATTDACRYDHCFHCFGYHSTCHDCDGEFRS